jgi:hypothetical protein
MTKTLAQVVGDFARKPQVAAWATPARATGQCHVASSAFLAYLRRHGLDGRLVRARHREWGFHGPANGGERYGHTAVEVDGSVYDWTARGNDPTADGEPHKGRGWNPSAPLPGVMPLADFYAAWGESVDCCPDCGNTTGHRLFQGQCQGPAG